MTLLIAVISRSFELNFVQLFHTLFLQAFTNTSTSGYATSTSHSCSEESAKESTNSGSGSAYIRTYFPFKGFVLGLTGLFDCFSCGM